MSTPASNAVGLPEQFGRYRIVRQLGQGGMGAVYLARDTRLDRDVALKVCTLADNPKALERFRREAKAAAALSHPNLCPLYDYDIHNGIAFITMKFVDGSLLGKWVEANSLDFRGIAILVYKLAQAMQAAHEGGVIHRDLKPGNIAIDKKGEAVILDFGLARQTDQGGPRLTHLGARMGTPSYMAPEQVDGDPTKIGPACDVYALGVIFYELLTGELPFLGTPEMILAQVLAAQPKAPRKFDPDIPESLESICLKALSKKPEERFPSMKAIADALARVVCGLATSSGKSKTVPPLPPTPTQLTEVERSRQLTVPPLPTNLATTLRPDRRGPWLAVGLSLVLIAVLAVAVWSGVQTYRSAGQTDDKNKTVEQADPKKDKQRDKDKELVKKPDPMPVVDLPQPLNCSRFAADAATVQVVQQAWAKHLKTDVERTVDLGNGVKMKMALIPPGKFRMGATQDEFDVILKQYKSAEAKTYQGEFPQHEVELTKGFWLGTYTVTQEEFDQLMDRKPSYFQNEKANGVVSTRRFPVENVTWYDAVEFCNKLTVKIGKKPCYLLTKMERDKDGAIIKAEVSVLDDGTGFRLPTEAEWEYACRAGTMTPFHFGSTLNGTEANCDGNYPHGTEKTGPYLKQPRAVGEEYKPNAFGLHNMHGNVYQWCQDAYDEGFYGKEPIKDPVNLKWIDSSRRVVRGGSWSSYARGCRAACRYWYVASNRLNYVGFRLCLRLD